VSAIQGDRPALEPNIQPTSSLVRHTLREAGGGRNREHLVEASWQIIAEGSKSFAVASMLFDLTTREQVWMLYAWCRRCDDLIDGQEMGGELNRNAGIAERVKVLRVLTRAALNRQPTAEVAFDAYGQVASETGLTLEDAEEVIAGFELDEQDWRPRTEDDLMRYCYYVAGAVGLMMGVVMGVDREDTETLDQAVDLGLSFQLANIARDILEDDAGGRCYLPLEWLVEEDIEPGQHTKPHHRQELADMAARHWPESARCGDASLVGPRPHHHLGKAAPCRGRVSRCARQLAAARSAGG